jgi:hypothetical protein
MNTEGALSKDDMAQGAYVLVTYCSCDNQYQSSNWHYRMVRPVHGLIFLFKWQGRDPASATNQAPIEYENPDVFFAQQVPQK